MPYIVYTSSVLHYCIYFCLLIVFHCYSGTISKLAACYDRFIKTFFGFRRSESVTQILFNRGLPNFNTVLHNCKAIFLRTWLNSTSCIVAYIGQILMF